MMKVLLAVRWTEMFSTKIKATQESAIILVDKVGAKDEQAVL